MACACAARLAALEAALRALTEEVRALRTARRARSAPAVFVALATAAADRAFSVRELVDHTRIDPQLRDVLVANDLLNARRLGKWLQPLTGATIASLRLEHVGDDRDGAVWRLFVAHSRDPL